MRILAIHTFPGASETAARHYPYYEKVGADRIVGITTNDGQCKWTTADVIEIGPNSYVRGDHLCRRLIDTIEACMALGATEIIIAEYDTLFFHKLQSPLPAGITMNRTGGNSPGFKGSAFYHGPWIMDVITAARVIDAGREMLDEGDIEGGWPDRFIGWLAEKYQIPVNEGFFKNYTQNTLDQPHHLEEARAARIAGAFAIHGVKSHQQFDYVTS